MVKRTPAANAATLETSVTSEAPRTDKPGDQYASLNTLSYSIGYLEQLIAILSEPFLMAATVIAFIDFATHGGLLAIPLLNYAWAGVVAIAVTASFMVTWRKAAYAFQRNQYGLGVFLVFLAILLGAADFAAVDTQALMQTLGITFNAALAQLSLNAALMTHMRSFVTIAMGAVVALSNHKSVSTAQKPARKFLMFERALNKFAPLAADVNAQVAAPALPAAQPATLPAAQIERQDVPIVTWNELGKVDTVQFPGQEAVKVHASAIDVAAPGCLIDTADSGTLGRNTGEHEAAPVTQLHLVLKPIERVRQAIAAEPGASDRRLGTLAGVSPNTAKKYRAVLGQERQAAVS